MNSYPPLSRRAFLKASVLTAAAFSLPRFSIGQPGKSANGKIHVACIGIGNRGFFAVSELMKNPAVQIVALCDVDQRRVQETYKKAAALKMDGTSAHVDLTTIPLFSDYREMFAKMGDQIDAVTVSTPDHHHFPAAMMAIQRGKHVYVEKPLTHSIGEARALRAAAKKHGIISQMGNQGRTTDGIRFIREWTQAGVLGDVKEVHAWSPAFPKRYYTRPDSMPLAAQPVPPEVNWDVWLGPAQPEPYNALLMPEKWRGFWKFGNGMLGDWACHTLDGPWWALDLGAPTSVEAQVSEVDGRIVPDWAEVVFKFPARGNRSPVTLRWSEGDGHKPPVPSRWVDDAKKPGLPERGMFMLGDKNTLFAPIGRPDTPTLLGADAMKELNEHRPAETIPRVVGGPMSEWIRAIEKTGPMPGSNFDYSAQLSEMVLLGVLAVRTGKRIEWDAKAGKITNDKSLNKLVEISARDGWKV